MKQTIDGETIYSVYGLDGTLRYRHNVTTGETTDYLRLGRSGPTVVRVLNGGASYESHYVHNDHLGSAGASTSTTTSGHLLWRESYTPFGETLNNPAANADNPGHYRGLLRLQSIHWID